VAPTAPNTAEGVVGDFDGSLCLISVAEGTASEVCKFRFGGHGGVPAGCQAVPGRRELLVADMRHGICRVDVGTGAVAQLVTEAADATSSDGASAMQGCNDCALDSQGRLWVTAPAGPIAPRAYARSETEAFGCVYLASPIPGQSWSDPRCECTAVKVAAGFLFSNGIVVTPDKKRLVVAETVTKQLWMFDICGDGPESRLMNKRLVITVPGDHEGGPDGMDFDADGSLVVANHGGGHIEVVDVDAKPGAPPSEDCGRLLRRVVVPFAQPSNVHFAAPPTGLTAHEAEAWRSTPAAARLYVTEHTNNAVWVSPWPAAGWPQACDADFGLPAPPAG